MLMGPTGSAAIPICGCERVKELNLSCASYVLLDVRAWRSLLLGHFEIKKMDSHLLLDVIEQFSREPETGGPRPSSWDLCEAIESLSGGGAHH